jgi:FkbM family methyltransferase
MKKITKNILSKFGLKISKIKAIPTDAGTKSFLLYNFYNTLKAFGFEPKHIVDVGANHGTWTREALQFFPNAQYTLVEPQYWMEESISDILKSNGNVKFYPFGAGEQEGSFQFTILDRDDSCSFKYTAEEAAAMGYKQLALPVITLNKLLATHKLPVPDIIKIDAEGLDIQVLNGASDYFGKTEIFMVEAGVVNKSFDNSLLKLMNYMDGKGYRLFEITDLNRPYQPKVLWLVELVFVLKGGQIDSMQIANS